MIIISHALETGTVVYGTSQSDGTGQILRQAGFRPSRYLTDHPTYGEAYWYLASTRRRRAKRYDLDRCATALRDAGHEVSVEVDNTTLPTTTFAELEAERSDRAKDRTDRFGEYADNATAKGSAIVDQVDAERRRIPLGQPHLIGHHSYNRTVRAEEKRNTKEDRGREHLSRGKRWSGRAQAAADTQTHREALGTTRLASQKLDAKCPRASAPPRPSVGDQCPREATPTLDLRVLSVFSRVMTSVTQRDVALAMQVAGCHVMPMTGC